MSLSENMCYITPPYKEVNKYLSARNQSYVTILHVEFYKPLCRAQPVQQIGENQKSILFFYPKLWNFKNGEKIKS